MTSRPKWTQKITSRFDFTVLLSHVKVTSRGLSGDFLGQLWSQPISHRSVQNEVQHVLMSITNVSHSCPLGLGEASALFDIKNCQTKVEGMHIYNMLQLMSNQ